MKIKVRNLGPIREEAEFDLKPLTILIGPNNAGKTWLAYTLAGILGIDGWGQYTTDEQAEILSNVYPPISKAVTETLIVGTSTIDLYDFADQYAELYFNNMALHARNWLSDFMGTDLVHFDKLELSINLADDKKRLLDRILASAFQDDIGLQKSTLDNGFSKHEAFFKISKKRGQKKLYMFTHSEGQIEEALPKGIIEEHLIRRILRALHRALYPNTAILPTERTTFIALPFNMQRTHEVLDTSDPEYKQLAGGGKKLSFPIGRYIESVADASQLGSGAMAKRESEAQRNPSVRSYMQFAHFLEQNILGGKVDYSDPEPKPGRNVVFQPAEGVHALEISIASSMVKELAPLVFYLRYSARPGELLVIDEPEMNLHPKAQVQIIEFLAMLVNAGLHVLITTHSPYMIDHLSNLTIAHTHTDKESIRPRFFLQDTRAFISKDTVAMYLVNQGKVINALDENLDWDSFGDVSNRISDIYFSL